MLFTNSTLFNPAYGALGGSLIALASTSNLLLNGRITGYSGMINNAFFKGTARGFEQRMLFLNGTATSAVALQHAYGTSSLIGTGINVNTTSIMAAGALVGFGTVLGSGCTSGHGISGLPRLSKRSLVAVSTFMTSGLITRSLVSQVDCFHAMAYSPSSYPKLTSIKKTLDGIFIDKSLINPEMLIPAAIGLTSLHAFNNVRSGVSEDTYASLTAAYGSGAVFGGGLYISGMTEPQKVLDFLDIFGIWDPTLAFVMGAGVAINLPLWYAITRYGKKPLLLEKFDLPTSTDITKSLVVGNSLFGVGWGLAGICPGPGLMGLMTLDTGFATWFGSLGLGMMMCNSLQRNGVI